MKKKKRKEKRKLNDSFGVFADVSINHHHHKSTATTVSYIVIAYYVNIKKTLETLAPCQHGLRKVEPFE